MINSKKVNKFIRKALDESFSLKEKNLICDRGLSARKLDTKRIKKFDYPLYFFFK
jgi:hypothetical protein